MDQRVADLNNLCGLCGSQRSLLGRNKRLHAKAAKTEYAENAKKKRRSVNLDRYLCRNEWVRELLT